MIWNHHFQPLGQHPVARGPLQIKWPWVHIDKTEGSILNDGDVQLSIAFVPEFSEIYFLTTSNG